MSHQDERRVNIMSLGTGPSFHLSAGSVRPSYSSGEDQGSCSRRIWIDSVLSTHEALSNVRRRERALMSALLRRICPDRPFLGEQAGGTK
jgi:hypothetical protein